LTNCRLSFLTVIVVFVGSVDVFVDVFVDEVEVFDGNFTPGSFSTNTGVSTASCVLSLGSNLLPAILSTKSFGDADVVENLTHHRRRLVVDVVVVGSSMLSSETEIDFETNIESGVGWKFSSKTILTT